MSEKNIKVREAARIAGVSPSTISAWCSGGKPDNFRAVKRLAQSLDVSFCFLLTGEEDAKSNPSHQPHSITEVFEEGRELFNGFAKIVVVQMMPRNQRTSSNEK